jgi:hypothetical protein
VLEKTPTFIERFRSVLANWGYFGGSVINSAADMSWMAFGFWLALAPAGEDDGVVRASRRPFGDIGRAG